jgi:hypothetical protein
MIDVNKNERNKRNIIIIYNLQLARQFIHNNNKILVVYYNITYKILAKNIDDDIRVVVCPDWIGFARASAVGWIQFRTHKNQSSSKK